MKELRMKKEKIIYKLRIKRKEINKKNRHYTNAMMWQKKHSKPVMAEMKPRTIR
jgi:hypothetical protein